MTDAEQLQLQLLSARHQHVVTMVAAAVVAAAAELLSRFMLPLIHLGRSTIGFRPLQVPVYKYLLIYTTTIDNLLLVLDGTQMKPIS